MKRIYTLLLAPILAMIIASPQVLAEHEYRDRQANTEFRPTAEQMIVDGLIYRPSHLAGTALGLGVFIVTLPFSILGGNVDQAGQQLVVEPAKTTFGTCLGCLPDYTYTR